jgi:hypothetical protein
MSPDANQQPSEHRGDSDEQSNYGGKGKRPSPDANQQPSEHRRYRSRSREAERENMKSPPRRFSKSPANKSSHPHHDDRPAIRQHSEYRRQSRSNSRDQSPSRRNSFNKSSQQHHEDISAPIEQSPPITFETSGTTASNVEEFLTMFMGNTKMDIKAIGKLFELVNKKKEIHTTVFNINVTHPLPEQPLDKDELDKAIASLPF